MDKNDAFALSHQLVLGLQAGYCARDCSFHILLVQDIFPFDLKFKFLFILKIF